jgi:hypothetical protein
VYGLKRLSEKNATSTIAMMSIAHPYVIRYSIADCDFDVLFDDFL